jgi:membrane fusion protein, macrolide-specific efflux system
MTQYETIAPDRALPPPKPPPPTDSARRVHRFATRRWVTIGLVVVLVVGGGLGAWLATRPAAASTVSTRIVTVAYGTIEQTASATGTIAAANTADLDFSVSGRVTAVDVSVGQSVTAGQALATVDPTALSAQVDEAQATLDSDNAKLSADQSSTSTSSAQVTADESAVTAAQASLSAAQESLSDATLTSTITGTVAALDLTVGQ